MLKWHCSDPPDYHLPLKAAAVPRSDRPYQNPWVAADAKIQERSYAALVLVAACALALAEAGALGEQASDCSFPPAYDFFGKSRRAGEYSGYTWDHLPKKFDASLAILAARMAFSSLLIRCALR